MTGVIMKGITWGSPEEKVSEWAFAEQVLMPEGKLAPDGSKLRRKHYKTDLDLSQYSNPPESLNHSFLVIDGRILVMAEKHVHLGSGREAKVKVAEDKEGNLFALKIMKYLSTYSDILKKESIISHDLGISGKKATSAHNIQKHYLAYQYLGIPLQSYFDTHRSMSLDERYEFAIKAALALHNLHSRGYQHLDIHLGNLVLDAKGQVHFIDFGKSGKVFQQNKTDIVDLLLLLYKPESDRNLLQTDWIFGDWIGEYQFSYSERPVNWSNKLDPAPHIFHIFVEIAAGEIPRGKVCTELHYAFVDLYGVIREGVIPISELGLETNTITIQFGAFSLSDIEKVPGLRVALEQKILAINTSAGHILDKEDKNKTLTQLLKDPTALHESTSVVPTALDIAETLTLCRLGLDRPGFGMHFVKFLPQDTRLELVHILNTISPKILALNERIKALDGSESSLLNLVGNVIECSFLCNQLIESTLLPDYKIDENDPIKKILRDIHQTIAEEREAWRIKNTPIGVKVPVIESPPPETAIKETAPDETIISTPSIGSLTAGGTSVASPSLEALHQRESQEEENPELPTEPQSPELVELVTSFAPTDPAIELPSSTSLQLTEAPLDEIQSATTGTKQPAKALFMREVNRLQTLCSTLTEEEQTSTVTPAMTAKQLSAKKAALEQAKRVLQELNKQYPLTAKEEFLPIVEADLINLSQICSYITEGLRFVAGAGKPFSYTPFQETDPAANSLSTVEYDLALHQRHMEELSTMAATIDGSGWKNLRTALIILAGLMMVACGILAAIPTGGIGLTLGLGGAAILTGGLGFFVGQDTGLAKTVTEIQLGL